MTAVDAVALALIGVAALVSAAWVVRARRLVDRAVGLDTMVAVLVNGLAVSAAATSDGIFLELVLLTVVLGFLGTVAVSRYVQRRHR
jgi:multisubunit Na+/H+ antiporter MnhF subunit